MATSLVEASRVQPIVSLPQLPIEIHRKVWTGISELDVPFGLEALIGTGEIATTEGLGWFIQAQAHCFGVRARDAKNDQLRVVYESQAAYYLGALGDPIAQKGVCSERYQHYQNQAETFGRQEGGEERMNRASQAAEKWWHLANHFPGTFE